eukprot:TRINITY_DN19571_c0_g1_i2.p1 TRINITY_DN19571_c0_g1~~TRINITY_DN19571_c0_g1_i2.p1  ORF type:complete len:244 (-),score=57.97 TRINITY_DN19571_c0_g1_i2:152-883(-)
MARHIHHRGDRNVAHLTECLEEFGNLEILSENQGNGMCCYTCTRDTFIELGLPLNYLTSHYPLEEKAYLSCQRKPLDKHGNVVARKKFDIIEEIKPPLQKVSVEKRMCLAHLPMILTIHLKRFMLNPNGSLNKILVPVQIPLKLQLSEERENQKFPVTYELYGVVNHSGSLHVGHYTALTKVTTDDKDMHLEEKTCESHEEKQEQWFYFSDQYYSRIDVSHVLESSSTNGYLFFYKMSYPSRR